MSAIVAPIAAGLWSAGAIGASIGLVDAAASAGPALAIGGSAVSAVSQYEQGQYTAQAAEYNANVAKQQAQYTAEADKSKAFDLSVQRRKTIGQQVAMAGAAGVNVNTGSPLDLMANTAAQYERDIQYAGQSAQEALVVGGEEARLYEMEGRQASLAGWMGAGSSLMSGLGSQYYLSKKTSLGG